MEMHLWLHGFGHWIPLQDFTNMPVLTEDWSNLGFAGIIKGKPVVGPDSKHVVFDLELYIYKVKDLFIESKTKEWE